MSIAYFNNETEKEWKNAADQGILKFGTAVRNKHLKDGELVIMVNDESKKIIGVARLGGSAIKTNLVDHWNIYTLSKYNEYEIPIKSIFIFSNALDYKPLQNLLGIDKKIKSSLTHYQYLSNGGIRKFNIWSDKKEEILDRLSFWMSTYL